MKLQLTLLICTISLFASANDLKPYEWQKDRKRYTLSEKEKEYNEYLLKYHKEYHYEWENDVLIFYVTEHRITRVTNSEAIQRHNRIYISMNNVLELVNIKARSISVSGKVTVFDESNLKEIKDEQSNNSYKIFAIEGIEPDSELEYFYTLKKKWSSWETAYFQFEMPIKTGTLQLSCPKKLAFAFKVYFDTVKMNSDTLNNRNIYSVLFSKVPGLAQEKFSFFDANRKRVEMKLAYNYTRSTARLNTWTDAAKSYYRAITSLDEKSEKQVIRFAHSMGDDKKWPTVKRIKNIEDKIKDLISITERGNTGGYESIPDILKYKQASTQGILRLFNSVFSVNEIPCQIVVTCNREIKKFDGSFDSWTYLSDFLLYFPSVDGFLSPNENELRYPLVPAKFTAHKGLFIEPVAVGSIKSGIGSIKEIPPLPYTSDKNDHIITVSFDEAMEANTIQQKLVFLGPDASYLPFYYSTMNAEQKDKFIEELLRQTIPDLHLIKWSAVSSTQNELPKFEIDANFTSGHFLEVAGNKVLFKVGELIGPQSELYRDENRSTDIENPNNRSYDREISINIPKGYKINNANALNMNVLYQKGDQVPFQFTSQFSIEKSVLKIAVKEYYKEIYVPQSRYEDFRKVVNAAADFNKIVLVFEKL
ncbi:MAG: hypothetical protein C0523_07650 [Cytophaga sp.]|nr:hypothetical protein [Cytophaga sp.]